MVNHQRFAIRIDNLRLREERLELRRVRCLDLVQTRAGGIEPSLAGSRLLPRDPQRVLLPLGHRQRALLDGEHRVEQLDHPGKLLLLVLGATPRLPHLLQDFLLDLGGRVAERLVLLHLLGDLLPVGSGQLLGEDLVLFSLRCRERVEPGSHVRHQCLGELWARCNARCELASRDDNVAADSRCGIYLLGDCRSYLLKLRERHAGRLHRTLELLGVDVDIGGLGLVGSVLDELPVHVGRSLEKLLVRRAVRDCLEDLDRLVRLVRLALVNRHATDSTWERQHPRALQSSRERLADASRELITPLFSFEDADSVRVRAELDDLLGSNRREILECFGSCFYQRRQRDILAELVDRATQRRADQRVCGRIHQLAANVPSGFAEQLEPQRLRET